MEFDFFFEISADHAAYFCSSICEDKAITRDSRARKVTLLGNCISSTDLPAFLSPSASFRHCVDLPDRSQPSKTISAPLRIVVKPGTAENCAHQLH